MGAGELGVCFELLHEWAAFVGWLFALFILHRWSGALLQVCSAITKVPFCFISLFFSFFLCIVFCTFLYCG